MLAPTHNPILMVASVNLYTTFGPREQSVLLGDAPAIRSMIGCLIASLLGFSKATLMTKVLPSQGDVVDFLYPITNEVGIRPRLRKRRLLIESVRDLLSEPLTPEDIARRPHVRRGRFLAIGLDLDKGERRQFYWDWSHLQKLEVIHSDGEKTGITSGKTRYERTCFGEICAQLTSAKGLTVGIRKAA